ncbi:MAG TPA: ribbon-helix-helix domain-containing protein [Beijerinckiaceae bacterium]|nr:ribbon-helix-helix domain-containing protein [Beijerinckiaceae bacterium]
MPKPPKPSLKAIVAQAVPAAQDAARVVRFRAETTGSGVRGRGTLKERSKQLSVYLDPAVYEQLRDLAYTERTKIHPLMLEALDLLFSKRGALSIGELEARSGAGFGGLG